MKIKSIALVGFGSNDVKRARDFFKHTLGLEVANESMDDDFVMFSLPSNQYLELLGEKNNWSKFLKRPVIAFEVDDVPTARSELEYKGVKFVSEIAKAGGFVWAFFEGPDGYLYEICSKPKLDGKSE